MKRFTSFFLILALGLGLLAALPSQAQAGWVYSSTFRQGYQYYHASCGYAAGYYYYQYAPTYHTPTYYPTVTYSASYNPDSARQLEIIDKAMSVLARMAENGGALPAPPGTGPLRAGAAPKDGPSIVAQSCAACHAADRVDSKGSKLALLGADGKVPDFTPDQKRAIVERTHSADPKLVMPPGKPLPSEQQSALAGFLGVTVVRTR